MPDPNTPPSPARTGVGSWREELDEIDRLMRMVSTINDPQEMVRLYGDGVDRIFPCDEFVALSRRDLDPPRYRVTRSSRMENVDPWRNRDRLPLFDRGMLGDLLYADRPTVIQDFRPDPNDPAFEHLRGMRSLLALPAYDNGVGVNMTVMLWERPDAVDVSRVPTIHWQSSLFGRATLNMVLRRQLSEAYDALDRELLAVAEIQRALLPATMPAIEGASLAARYETSARAGGDYFDAFPLPGGQWGLFIADVSGHGTPAAVGMAITHSLAHAHPGPPEPPERVLGFLNDNLATTYARCGPAFVTAIYAIYDPATRTLAHANAGHPPPRVIRDGRVLQLDSEGNMPLGIDPGIQYPRNTTTLQPGDRVLFYTDGITETFSDDRRMLGVEGLDRALLRGGRSAQGVVDAAVTAAEEFSGSPQAQDDRTAMCLSVDR